MSLNRATVAKRYAKHYMNCCPKRPTGVRFTELKELRSIFQDNPQLSTLLSDASLQVAEREA